MRVAAGVGIGIGALLTAAFGTVAIFGDRWANDLAQRTAAELAREWGRPVRIGDVSLSALRGRVELRDLLIGAAPDEPRGAPALELASAEVDVGMLRTLLTLGFYPYVEGVRARDLRVSVVERTDGTTNWTRITGSDTPPDTQPDAPLDARVRRARIGEVDVDNVALSLYARGEVDAQARVTRLALRGRDLGWSAGGMVDLDAAVLATERNLRLHAEVGPLDEAEALPPIDALQITLAPTQLAPLSRFLAGQIGAGSAPERGVLRIDLDLRANDDAEARATGSVQLTEVVLPRGKPFDAALRVDLSANPEAGDLDLRSGVVQLGPMQVRAQATVENLNDAPTVRRIAVRSEALSFEALRAIYPAFDARTAPARWDGPFRIAATGKGDAHAQSADLELSFTDTHIAWPEVLDKPAGTPLSIQAKLQSGEHALAFAPLRVQLADFQVLAHGKVSELDRPAKKIALTVETPNPEIASLLRLLPPVARATKKGDALGKLTLRGKLEGTTERYQADATLALSALRVKVPGTHLEGGGEATLSLRDSGHGEEGALNADFGGLTALYADLVNKRAGEPMKIDAQLTRKGDDGTLSVSTTLASLVMRAAANLHGQGDDQTFDAELDVARCAVRGVARLLPGLDARGLGDIALTARMEAKGTLGNPASMQLKVPSFHATAGNSELRGTLSATHLARPEVSLTAQASFLDLADFLPRAASDEPAKKPEGAPPATEPGLLGELRGHAKVDVARGRAASVDFEQLAATLRLEDGVAIAERLEVGVFGGRFHGTGSRFPLIAGRGSYQLTGGLENVQVESALAQLAGTRDLLTGKLTAKVDVSARDLTPAALTSTLTGVLAGNLVDAAYLPGHGFAQLTEQLGAAASVPPVRSALEAQRARLGLVPGKAWDLKDLAGTLRFQDGAALLERPITLQTPQGEVKLEGKLGLTSATALSGTFALTPESLSDLTQGKARFEQSVTLPFQVEGALLHPAFRFSGLERVVQPLLAAFVRDEGARTLKKGAEQLTKQPSLKDRVDDTRRALEKLGRRKDGA
ncbi:MAG: AsmA-like C-terminal region-containing protein [Polyangiales bacterium]